MYMYLLHYKKRIDILNINRSISQSEGVNTLGTIFTEGWTGVKTIEHNLDKTKTNFLISK